MALSMVNDVERRLGGVQGWGGGGGGRGALEGKEPQRRPHRRFDRGLEEVVKAVGSGYYRLQMPLKLAVAVRETVAGHRPDALEGGGGYPPPLAMHPWVGHGLVFPRKA